MCCQSSNLTILKRLTSANEPSTCLSARRRCGDVGQRSTCAAFARNIVPMQPLRETHLLSVTFVVIVQAKERNRGKWPLGIVENLIVGTDGVVRGAVLRSGKSRIERAVQHLYPLEFSCDRPRPHLAELNPQARPFRPRRDAAVAARLRVQNCLPEMNCDLKLITISVRLNFHLISRTVTSFISSMWL